MLYQPGKTPHNLPFDPFKACIVPRPIGWISTTSPLAPPTNDAGQQQQQQQQQAPPSPRHNLAPYSQFAQLNFDPPYILFSANQNPHADSALDCRKDTVRNIEATGKFAWNLATYDLRDAVNISAQQLRPGDDEFVHAGLEKEFTTLLPGDDANPVPMVRASPVRFECVHHSTLRLPGNGPVGSVDVVIGRVVGVHIADGVLDERGRIDVGRVRPIARCGYYEYAVVGEEGTVFEMVVPGADEVLLAGLEGSSQRVEAWTKAKMESS
ncbi:hypothetical protein NEMBOFW57_009549 [Staphylotrichum longicolle]|uniref:Flavin reductase like domain-containing protein n=1 Tax=Staphylotrichum longicolle TaxID=669026 RepID=A0AAD4EPL3_9PEZI|nr:hypothetical protein NEMBOFW57_009549 [Staphylotrichum longicolle]